MYFSRLQTWDLVDFVTVNRVILSDGPEEEEVGDGNSARENGRLLSSPRVFCGENEIRAEDVERLAF